MITVAFPSAPGPGFERLVEPFIHSPLVSRICALQREGQSSLPGGKVPEKGLLCAVDSPVSGSSIRRLIGETRSKYLLWFRPEAQSALTPEAIGRLADVAEATGAGIVYGNYAEYPVNDVQPGSIRDTFDFGPAMLIRVDAAKRCLQRYGDIGPVRHAGLYDLRLKISADYPLFRIPEPLSIRIASEGAASDSQFAYVDPRHREYQIEMEQVATDHLRRIGAYLEPRFEDLPVCEAAFPVEASVIIPVRNREQTVADAVKSACAQTTDFPFNVLVVDNHSSDGTTQILRRLSEEDRRVRHLVPERMDLGIGGCWDEAFRSPLCGRYAVQLDSDDLYSGDGTLQRIVDVLREGDAAMVIGSYTIVNEQLEEIPPGLIDHREWTDGNGRNNALRINGLGAPRAFRTDILRRIGFPNVSYGEDYAVALRISRQYRIGRIYESLYLCRRWGGNTDAALSPEVMNRYDAYKDSLRTMEILARQTMNRSRAERGDSEGHG